MSQDLPHHDNPTPNNAPYFSGLLGLGKMNLVSALFVDNKNWRLWISLSAVKNLCLKIPQINRFDIFEKIKVR